MENKTKRKVKLISIEHTRDMYRYDSEMHGLHSEFYVEASEKFDGCWYDDEGDAYRVEDLEFID